MNAKEYKHQTLEEFENIWKEMEEIEPLTPPTVKVTHLETVPVV